MRVFVLSVLVVAATAVLAVPATSYAQSKVAVIRIQEAIARCNDGQAAAKTLREKFGPKQQDLERQQREINELQNQLRNQEKTLSDEARNRLLRSIDEKTRALTRANEDAQAEAQQAEQDAVSEIGRKMMSIITEHSKGQGYSLVVDVSSPQTPVLYADSSLDITEKVIELYNAAGAKTGSAAPSSGAAPSGGAPPAASQSPAAKPPAATTPKAAESAAKP
ncbi:MAG: OmpH family outer membrane protein [Acidobacteria bacterium]|nr:OmpH family outer membrane protein [Acidobacteriota bacterium]